MRLKEASIKFAMRHVYKDGDTDLFPVPFEFSIIKRKNKAVVNQLKNIEINGYAWEGPRRLMVPKSDFAFRSVCQLAPLDAILFAAVMKEIGKKIEKRRLPETDGKVFSYRFKPTSDGSLYGQNTGWEEFWKKSKLHCDQHNFVLITDISDFYNQIYHHTIENQLERCGVAVEYWHAVKNLLSNTSEGVSRGIPIGPHPAHLLAELAMIPIDEFLNSLGLTWCRYVDDIHIFCDSRDDAHTAIFKFVDYLDKTQKIQINKQKTKILASTTFQSMCEQNVIDQPITADELAMLETVKHRTTGPYHRISITKLSRTELEKLSKEKIEKVLNAYISAQEVDYVRLRWFIRRLTQVGAPGGINFIVKNFDHFLPCLAEVGNYFESSMPNFEGQWKDIGEDLLKLYQSGIIQASEYLQIVILSLFGRIRDLNHINDLTKIYSNSSAMCQRKIVMAAATARSTSWLSTLKGDYKNADPWLRRAILYSLRVLPPDEKTFWLKSVKRRVDGLDKLIVDCIA